MYGFRKGMLALGLTAATIGGGVAATEAFSSPAFAADTTTTTAVDSSTDTTTSDSTTSDATATPSAPSTDGTAPAMGDGNC